MRNVIENFVKAAVNEVEKFGGARTTTQSTSTTEAFASLVGLVIVYIILLLVGKFLWNEYLVKYVTIVKPLPGIVELMAISVLLRLFFC
jgi:hypothetical protein